MKRVRKVFGKDQGEKEMEKAGDSDEIPTFGFEYPLRRGKVVVKFQGVPADLTTREVERLKAFLLALVQEEEPEEVKAEEKMSNVELFGGS